MTYHTFVICGTVKNSHSQLRSSVMSTSKPLHVEMWGLKAWKPKSLQVGGLEPIAAL